MIFVYYSDDYMENSGVGLELFETPGEARRFILGRMREDHGNFKPSVENYRVIDGKELTINITERVSDIELVKGR